MNIHGFMTELWISILIMDVHDWIMNILSRRQQSLWAYVMFCVFLWSYSTDRKYSKPYPRTPVRTYRFLSTGLCNYKPYERTYRRKTCCMCGFTVLKFCFPYLRKGLFLRVRRYGLLYLGTVEHDLCLIGNCIYLQKWSHAAQKPGIMELFRCKILGDMI